MLGKSFLNLASIAIALCSQTQISQAGVAGTSPFSSDFIEYANAVLDEWKVPGASIAVLDGDDVFARGFGFATLPNTSATPETLWSTGSTTKAFTATALSLLIAGNNNSQLPRGWSTPISSIIPDDFVLHDEWATHHVTLEDAVSHRTGMPRHDYSIPQKIEGRPATVRDLTRNLRHLRPTFEPRVRWQYCNYMFAVLSHVIETVTGSHLEDVLRRHIWAPLGMGNTSFGARQGRKTPTLLSTGYYWNGEKYFSTGHDSLDTLSGIGAVVSSVLDYAKWLKCLTYQTAPFSEAVHRDIRQPRMLEPLHDFLGPDVETYGLGWSRTNLHGNVAYGHTGSTMSGGAIVTWLPELHFGVIIFANTATSSNNIGRVLAMRILEDRLNVRQDLRYKIAERVREQDQQGKAFFANYRDILYPSRPEKPLPFSGDQSQLTGSYSEPGYGLIVIEEERLSQSSVEKTLIGRRPGRLENTELLFEHISGDFWVVRAWRREANATEAFFAADFRFNVSGHVESLRLALSPPGADMDEGNITFDKIG